MERCNDPAIVELCQERLLDQWHDRALQDARHRCLELRLRPVRRMSDLQQKDVYRGFYDNYGNVTLKAEYGDYDVAGDE